MPPDVHRLLEREAQQVNSTILANIRAYSDLIAHLLSGTWCHTATRSMYKHLPWVFLRTAEEHDNSSLVEIPLFRIHLLLIDSPFSLIDSWCGARKAMLYHVADQSRRLETTQGPSGRSKVQVCRLFLPQLFNVRAVSPIIPSAPKCSSRHFIFHRKCVCFE